MASPGPAYCPLIQTLINITAAASDPSARDEGGALSVFTIVLHGLFSSVGIVENLLVLGVVGFHVRPSVPAVWVLNLAASDLLATASLPFFTLYLARGKSWTLGTTFCRLHSSVFFLNMFVSGFLLAAVSADRCLVVLRPVWALNYRNARRVGGFCGAIWTLALLCTVPFYVFRDDIPLRNGKVLCYYNYARLLPVHPFDLEGLCRRRQEALAVFKFLLAFLLPLLVIVASYAAVNARLSRRGHRRPLRFVRLVVAVVVSFVLCWAPYHVLSLMEVLAGDAHPWQAAVRKALPIAATVGFLNSVLNPMLYVFSCADLRRRIRQSLGAVMESALAEDLCEMARRRSTASSLVSSVHFRVHHRDTGPNVSTEANEC